MLQIIHEYQHEYPFGLQFVHNATFLQVVTHFQKQIQFNQSKQKLETLLAITSNDNKFVKLTKILKQEDQLHTIFQYHPQSLLCHIQMISNQAQLQPIMKQVKKLTESLIKYKIIYKINFRNIIVEQDKTLKLFIHPSFKFYEQSSAQLLQFYQLQRKKFEIEIQEIFVANNGPLRFIRKSNFPNFIINGTSLMFLNEFQKQQIHCSASCNISQEKKSTIHDSTSQFTIDFQPEKQIQLANKTQSQQHQHKQYDLPQRHFCKKSVTNISNINLNTNEQSSAKKFQGKRQSMEVKSNNTVKIKVTSYRQIYYNDLLLEQKPNNKNKQEKDSIQQQRVQNQSNDGKYNNREKIEQLQKRIKQAKLKSQVILKGLAKY